ncbi:uncharacterized protein BCR38DRAFT_439825 [Pseudomassariella vexata]|uniref:Uncharacterized protein n=1 Tax=Pseudomassariella vexata TaxID=1141098 RepID=A0A1Y2DPT2_9PEZI|nr:uncharacterized protein BCR38DRAFT_439825 [Pseudomassariella vexata]ORY61303.1 hypothetical protein BCR38DRAFT_439825 [Pseudomassariella vexata]
MVAGLCSNRPEGFGPTSKITSPLPTQCFFDVVLAPLPTWIYLCSILLFLSPGWSRIPRPASTSSSPRPWVRRVLASVYYFLISVIVLMESVEIARLIIADLGIGTLPFVYVGCLLAVLLQATDGGWRRLRGWWAASIMFWTAGAVVTALKFVALTKFTGILAREETLYPVEHQFTDLVVLMIFYGFLVGAEVAMVVVRQKSMSGAAVETQGDVIQLRETLGK